MIALAAALTVLYLLLPEAAGAEVIRVLAPALGAGAVCVGLAAHQPRRVLAWTLVAGSLGLLAIAQLIWSRLYFSGSLTGTSLTH